MMEQHAETPEAVVEFIRLFFPMPAAEKVATACARLLAGHLGPRARLLRPETTLSELFVWIETGSRRSVEFIIALEAELGFELDEYLDDFGHVTFRDLVQHAIQHQPKAT